RRRVPRPTPLCRSFYRFLAASLPWPPSGSAALLLTRRVDGRGVDRSVALPLLCLRAEGVGRPGGLPAVADLAATGVGGRGSLRVAERVVVVLSREGRLGLRLLVDLGLLVRLGELLVARVDRRGLLVPSLPRRPGVLPAGEAGERLPLGRLSLLVRRAVAALPRRVLREGRHGGGAVLDVVRGAEGAALLRLRPVGGVPKRALPRTGLREGRPVGERALRLLRLLLVGVGPVRLVAALLVAALTAVRPVGDVLVLLVGRGGGRVGVGARRRRVRGGGRKGGQRGRGVLGVGGLGLRRAERLLRLGLFLAERLLRLGLFLAERLLRLGLFLAE